MQAITIGTGKWAKLAQYSAARMAEMTGLDVMVLGDKEVGPLNLSHPSWAKCWLEQFNPTDKDLFIADADVWCMKEWNPVTALADYPLVVVKDESSDQVRAECRLYGLDPEKYFNTGLMLVHAFSALYGAQRYHPRFGRWAEQTAINKAVQDWKIEPTYLPHAYNRLLWPGKDDYGTDALKALGAVNLHFASMHDPDLILSYMKKL